MSIAPGTSFPIEIIAEDGATDMYAQANVYDSGMNLLDTIELPHAAEGVYAAAYTFEDEGFFTVVASLYEDSEHSILAYSKGGEQVEVSGAQARLSAKVDRIGTVLEGHWKIHTTGPDANKLVLYEADGTTVLQKWVLKGANGSPTVTAVFERVPEFPIE